MPNARIRIIYVERSPSDRTERTLLVGAEHMLVRFSKVAGSGRSVPEQLLVTGILSLSGETSFRLQDISENAIKV